MGGCFSRSSLSSTFKTVRVVHLSGNVEEFEHPITVSELTGKPPSSHFLCCQSQFLTGGCKPLKPNVLLEPGHIYFLLPYSAFQTGLSPVDLAPVVRNLTAVAKNAKAARTRTLSSSPERIPGQFPDTVEPCTGVATALGMQRSSKSRSWKPLLSTIRERSFNQRSESDLLQESALDILKKI